MENAYLIEEPIEWGIVCGNGAVGACDYVLACNEKGEFLILFYVKDKACYANAYFIPEIKNHPVQLKYYNLIRD